MTIHKSDHALKKKNLPRFKGEYQALALKHYFLPVDSRQLYVLLTKSGVPENEVIDQVLLIVCTAGAENHPMLNFKELNKTSLQSLQTLRL